MKKCYCILMMSLFVFVGFSTSAFSDMDGFANPRPTYEFDWAFGTGTTSQGTSGSWYPIGLNPQVGQSTGEGTAYNSPSSNYWTPSNGMTNGFSLSNNIGDWMDAIGTGNATILYTIREDYSATGLVDNSDVVELFDNENEWLRMPGYTPGGANLGLGQGDDVTSLEWNVDFDAENLAFEHYFAVQGSGGTYQPNTYVAKNQDDESVYMTFGSKAQLASGNLYQVWRSDKTWDGTGNGYTSHGGWSLWTYLEGRNENLSTTYNGLTTFDGTNWFLPIYVDTVEYMQRLDLPYDGVNFPASSGAVIQWYDDYDLYLSGDIPDPGGAGVSGRYILERNTLLVAKSQGHWAHAADVCYEARTYNPTRNPDGPESPYEWVYDASGDMYVPTNGTALPGDTAAERAYKLLGNHSAFPDDDTWTECEESDRNIWKNQDEGVEGRSLFVDSWKLAGMMLGQEFWNDNPNYIWSGEMGAVCTRAYADEFMDYGNVGRLPVWTWNGTTSQWELPSTFDIYGEPPSHEYAHVWGWAEGYTDTPVAGYEALNSFMRYAFDIDALVVEDVDGDGEFDVGNDYVLFSVVDDGLYSKYAAWGDTYGTHDMNMDGQYFDGDTIFLYDGTSVTTFFDAATGIFFGQSISTATGYGSAVTLWAMGDLVYDLDALDISFESGIIPEPSTIFLMIGSASGLAVVAGVMRRKLR